MPIIDNKAEIAAPAATDVELLSDRVDQAAAKDSPGKWTHVISTHLPLDKMAATLQTIYFDEFLWKKLLHFD